MLDDEVVGGAGRAQQRQSSTPIGGHFSQLKEKTVAVLRNGIKAGSGAQSAIVFQTATDDFGKIVETGVRRELKALPR